MSRTLCGSPISRSLLCAAQSSCVGKVWKTSGALLCCNPHVVPAWSRGHTCDPLLLLCQMYMTSSVELSSRRVATYFPREMRRGHMSTNVRWRSLLIRCRRVGLFRSNNDPKICACRLVSLVSFQRSGCVTRLLSDPRHVAGSLEAKPCPMMTKRECGSFCSHVYN